MSTVSQYIATIEEQAAILDTAIANFRSAAAIIAAAENEIRQAQPGANHEAHAGRIRLAAYANALMLEPGLNGGKSVATVAAEAWQGVS